MSDFLPTRAQILEVLTHETLTSSQLRGRFNVGKKAKLAFKAVMAALVEDGTLTRNGKKEYVPAIQNSFGKPDRPVYEGRPAARRRRTDEAETVSKVRKGILVQEEMEYAVRDSETQKTYRVPNRRKVQAKPGQVVVFELYPHPKHRFEMLARITASAEDFGTFDQLKLEFHDRFDLPHAFPPAVEAEIVPMVEPTEADFAGRVDYRKTSIVCIDPLGARDHDDAVSIEKMDKGYRLGVHIADVSFYVKEDGALDNEAIERSFTQYLPWMAVPMLPERLSAELCSLLEGVDRLAFTCMMELDDKARVKSYEFHRSVIHVTRSITYEQAMELYEQKDPELMLMAEVTRLLKAERSRTGLLELGSVEYKVDFDEKNEPIGVSPRSSVESNSWIEECMLIANQCCAKELDGRKLHGIFRIHEAPDLSDIIELAQAEPELVRGAPVNIKDLPPSKQGDSNLNPQIFALYQYMVEKAKGYDPKIFKILRSMQKAHYDSNSFGHFALNWQDYAHFTSPIRRYADLWCHRELARTGKAIQAQRKHDVAEIADLISANEIKNQKCERAALKVCTAWILREHVGETFPGAISGMEEWGLFVSLDSPPADGLVRFRDLPGDDYWFFQREKNCVVGRRSRQSFRRGDRVLVQLLRVNPTKGEIDLAVLDRIEKAPPTGKESANTGKPERSPEFAESTPWNALKKPPRAPRPDYNAERPPRHGKSQEAPKGRFSEDGPRKSSSKASAKAPGKGFGNGPAKKSTFQPPKSAGKPRRGRG